MALPLVAAVVLLVSAAWAMYASWHGKNHVAARLAAVMSLTSFFLFGYSAYRGEANVAIAVVLGAFLLAALSLAFVKGRFQATPR